MRISNSNNGGLLLPTKINPNENLTHKIVSTKICTFTILRYIFLLNLFNIYAQTIHVSADTQYIGPELSKRGNVCI